MPKKYYWLKIGEHFFEDDKIIYLESLPNGEKYIIIWLKLLLKCLKDKETGEYGFLRFSEKIPYDDALLCKILKCEIDTLRVAMKYFIELDMIEITDNKTIYIDCVQSMMGKESDSAERMRKHREKKKLLGIECNNVTDCDVTSDPNKEKEVKKEVKKEPNETALSLSHTLFDEIMNNVAPTQYKNNKPNITNWSFDIEKLNRIDGITWIEISDMIKWATASAFWGPNILSGANLRKHYTKLELQKKADLNPPKTKDQLQREEIDRITSEIQ